MAAIGLVAASLAVSPAPAAEAATARIAGADRFETAVLASQQLPRGEAVFLASAVAFPDALAAAPVAAAEGAHLLLVRPDGIPEVVRAEISRLAPSEIVVLGSESALSAAVASEARALRPAAQITRIGGADRVDTSMQLFDRMRARTTVTDVWVASGYGFPDALAAGAVAAREGHGLVLTLGSTASFQQHIAARLGGVVRFHIPGSTSAVGDDVASMLRGTGRAVDRFPGSDRYETAVLINRAFTATGSGADMLLASGAAFPDGLVGAVYAGLRDDALYLTHPACASSNSVADEQQRLASTRLTVFGSTAAVSAAAADLVPCAASQEAVSALIDAVNAERAAAGQESLTTIRPLASDACLTRMGQGWANTMAAEALGGAAHNPDLTAEARACGLKGWGENVGRTWGGAPDVDQMMTRWMNSDGHRANILRSTFTHIGVGVSNTADGDWYYVLDFGTR